MENVKRYSDIVNKWFNETIRFAGNRPVIDEYFVASLVVANKYTKAFFSLLENNHVLPAKAMLRILAELFIKLAWCIDIENKNSSETEIINRFKLWAYHTEKERKKGLEKCLKATEDKGEINSIQQHIKEKEEYLKQFPQSIAETEFPRTVDLFTKEIIGGLDCLSGHLFYLKNYFLYNDAIHLDVRSIGKLVKRQDNVSIIEFDHSDNKEDLAKYCLYQALLIVFLIRKYYNQTFQELVEEYDNIVNN